MKLLIADYQGADTLCKNTFAVEWGEIEVVLNAIPLHLKASDQAGKQGDLIFNPVGTNEQIKQELTAVGWASNTPIPSQWDFLGKDVDFAKNGVIVEVQFSNYPFLLNNILRTELFLKSKVALPKVPPEMLIVVTKAHMFPASNSTLYFEQADKQNSALASQNMFNVPVRLVGLTENPGSVPCVLTTYTSSLFEDSQEPASHDLHYREREGKRAMQDHRAMNASVRRRA